MRLESEKATDELSEATQTSKRPSANHIDFNRVFRGKDKK